MPTTTTQGGHAMQDIMMMAGRPDDADAAVADPWLTSITARQVETAE